MEIILAICVTGLGIFGGMLVIWNGQAFSPKAPDPSGHGRVMPGTTKTVVCTTVVSG